MHPVRFIVLAACAAALAACGPDIPPVNGNGNGNGEPLEASWATVSETFGQSCAFSGCHATGSAQVILDGEAAFDNIVEVPSDQVPSLSYVEPGDPGSSYLYLKVAELQADACSQDGQAPTNCGERMPPPPSPPLPAERIQAIHDWIADGALRDD